MQTNQTFREPKLTFSKIQFSFESRHCFAGYTHKLTEQVAARERRSAGAKRERERERERDGDTEREEGSKSDGHDINEREKEGRKRVSRFGLAVRR